MTKRIATAAEIASAPTLPVRLARSVHLSDPISWGDKPELYGIGDLAKAATTQHLRTEEFERRLAALWWFGQEQPIPFMFRTADGKLRSLDAGCLGFLANRSQPDLFLIEKDGIVAAIVPSGRLLARQGWQRDLLIEAIREPG